MAQPFVYPDGLVEVPMSPISDIGAFRNGRWRLEWFLKAIESASPGRSSTAPSSTSWGTPPACTSPTPSSAPST